MQRLLLPVVSMVLFTTPVLAEEPRTVGVYKRHMQADTERYVDFDHKLHHMLYLSGLGDAYLTINAQRVARGEPPLFCVAETAPMSSADFMQILHKTLDRTDSPIDDQLSIAEAMRIALQDEFPCL